MSRKSGSFYKFFSSDAFFSLIQAEIWTFSQIKALISAKVSKKKNRTKSTSKNNRYLETYKSANNEFYSQFYDTVAKSSYFCTSHQKKKKKENRSKRTAILGRVNWLIVNFNVRLNVSSRSNCQQFVTSRYARLDTGKTLMIHEMLS